MDEEKVDTQTSTSLDDKSSIDEIPTNSSSNSTENSSELNKVKNDASSINFSILEPSSNTTIDTKEFCSSSEDSSVKTTETAVVGDEGGDDGMKINEDKTIVNENGDESVKSEDISTQNNAINTPAIVPLARSSPISREFLALQKSLNDSKILTEFVADTSAIKAARKARKSVLAHSSLGNREGALNKSINRGGDPLYISSEERNLAKRANMRSHNSEFAQRQMDFLNRVIHQQQSCDEQYASEADEMERYNTVGIDDEDEQIASVSNSSVTSSDVSTYDITNLDARSKGFWQVPPKRGWDSFCWKCCDCGGTTMIPCSNCPRSFHKHCVKVSTLTKLDSSWHCPECLTVENALSSPKNSRRPEISMDMLSELLSFALKRMRSAKGNSKFIFAEGDFSHLSKYIVNPVTFTSLEEKISKKVFRCPEEFFSETKWMIHNVHILTGVPSSKIMGTAKAIVKACRQETNEIETCASCYLGANTKTDWFVDVCAQPHLLLWAKLKGFPYWPAKAMGMGPNSVVNVRFFGKHDRAFVSVKDCFLYSERDPNTQTGKRSARELADCIKEVELHIKKIEAKVGQFIYAQFKTPYEPAEETQQLEKMMPGVQQYMKRQQALVLKPSLQYKIVKTADNHLSIIKKPNSVDGNCEDIQTTGLDLNEGGVIPRKDGNKSLSSSSSSLENPKQHSTSKYEVITKTTPRDSNSPKISTVILKKRKSYNIAEAFHSIETGDGSGGADEFDVPLSKITKLDEGTSNIKILNKGLNVADVKVHEETTNISTSGKRKQHVAELSSPNDSSESGSEKHKSKHSRSEPRLPILTIKANNVKIIEPTTREVAEHFAKSNPGVTIKKIPSKPSVTEMSTESAENANTTNGRATRSTAKELPATKGTATLTLREKRASTAQPTTIKNQTATITASATTSTSPPKTIKHSAKNSDKEKTYDEHERNIFRELVPFVEIKQELPSEDEAETTTTAPGLTLNNSERTTSQSSTNETVIPQQDTQIEPLLTKIKEEAISDDEAKILPLTANIVESATKSESHNKPNTVQSETPAGGSSAIKIGDTTIQRLSQKNAAVAAATVVSQQQPVTALNAGNTPANLMQHTGGNTNNNKRNSTRNSGVPYGPLPAAATSTSTSMLSLTGNSKNSTNTTHQQQQQQQQQQMQHQQQLQQRARKSFPNNSPPRSIVTTASTFPIAQPPNLVTNATNSPSPLIPTNATDTKRGGMLKSTSMVSIPADVAAQRNITQNSIPMPPLTAVTKTTSAISTVTNSIATTNTSNTLSNSNTVPMNVGTIAPASFASTMNSSNNSNSATNSNNNNTSNNNKNNNNNNVAFAPVNPSSTSAFMPTQNSTTKLSAPPPLAGLSFPNSNAATTAVIAQPQSQTPQPPTLPISTTISATINSNNSSSNNNNHTMITTTTTNNSNLNTSNLTVIPMDPSNVNSTANHLLGDLVTPAFANAITDVICRGPPKMARRPNGPLQSDGSTMFPSEAGPVCRTLVQNAHKLTDFFISVMEDTMCEMSNTDEPSLQAKITLLTMELERIKQAHEQEIAELKRTSDLVLCEMRKSMENEKTRIANEIRKQCELERLRCIEEAKRKQWCANCGREAQFYCCWNTSYCDYPCQQQHWARHAASCAQTRSNETSVSMTGPVGITNSQPAMSSVANMNSHNINSDGRNKSSNAVISNSTTINVQYNKNISSSRKDKHNSSSSHNNMASNVGNKNNLGGGMLSNNTTSATTEGLKLPSNTFLRPVTSNTGSNNNNSRSAGYNPNGPGPRFNISLPISSNINPPYTIVQRGNSWELMNSTNNSMPTMNTVNSVPGVQVSSNSLSTSLPNVHTQQRTPTMPNMVTSKGGGRNRGVSNMTYNPTSNGNMRSTQM